jgi:L-ascorbate metabolism protein UlaG (beta-lactamase superfamily)
VLLPVGAYEPAWIMSGVHMDPDAAVRAYREIADTQVSMGHPAPPMLPIHWGTFKLSDEPLDEPPARLRAAWQSAELPDDRLWLLRHGETRVG